MRRGIAPFLLVAVLSGCTGLEGVAAGAGMNVLGRLFDGLDRAADATDDYFVEGIVRRREIRQWIKEAENDECKGQTGAKARECWLQFYPTVQDLKDGLRGKPKSLTPDQLDAAVDQRVEELEAPDTPTVSRSAAGEGS